MSLFCLPMVLSSLHRLPFFPTSLLWALQPPPLPAFTPSPAWPHHCLVEWKHPPFWVSLLSSPTQLRLFPASSAAGSHDYHETSPGLRIAFLRYGDCLLTGPPATGSPTALATDLCFLPPNPSTSSAGDTASDAATARSSPSANFPSITLRIISFVLKHGSLLS